MFGASSSARHRLRDDDGDITTDVEALEASWMHVSHDEAGQVSAI